MLIQLVFGNSVISCYALLLLILVVKTYASETFIKSLTLYYSFPYTEEYYITFLVKVCLFRGSKNTAICFLQESTSIRTPSH
jgi:hypothetical protein